MNRWAASERWPDSRLSRATKSPARTLARAPSASASKADWSEGSPDERIKVMKQIHLSIILLAMAQLTGAVEGRAQGTAFTYQGRLQSGGSPANALYEMSFGL